jgi:hypothetical protein
MPEGQKPAGTLVPGKEGSFKVNFDCARCLCCPRLKDCPVIVGKFKASISYDLKKKRIAEVPGVSVNSRVQEVV